jgi:hypothetical protein
MRREQGLEGPSYLSQDSLTKELIRIILKEDGLLKK